MPEATSSDEIAQFSISPLDILPAGSDAWECLDPVLNRFLGYGIEKEALASKLRRGSLRVDGLLNWLSICIADIKIPQALLEGKVERIIEALDLWYDS